jgi:hypothetical protein
MRRTSTVTIDADGRDKGKTFVITEMYADQGEEWAIRALLALGHAGVEIPDEVASAGWQGMAAIGGQMLLKGFSGLEFPEAKPLLDEIMDCIQIKEPSVTRALTRDDIEEIQTRFFLRGEVLKLHVDFSKAAPAPE